MTQKPVKLGTLTDSTTELQHYPSYGYFTTFHVFGTFGTGEVVFEVSPDEGTTWKQQPNVKVTEDKAENLTVGKGFLIRPKVLTPDTNTDLDVWASGGSE